MKNAIYPFNFLQRGKELWFQARLPGRELPLEEAKKFLHTWL